MDQNPAIAMSRRAEAQPAHKKSLMRFISSGGAIDDNAVAQLRALVDQRLQELVEETSQAPQILSEALAYALLAPGKRVRPILVLLSSWHFGKRDFSALDSACAIEMVHASSLVMDDLPAMDDAKLRRGQPTVHVEYGEDLALLSVVGLLNLAYGVIASDLAVNADIRVAVMRTLSRAVGSQGLVGGQTLDLRLRAPDTNISQIERINACKTGELFAAAIEMGALLAEAPAHQLDSARRAGLELGLAFQIADDVLDSADHAGKTGKDTGKDSTKPTIASRLGKVKARQRFQAHVENCHAALASMNTPKSPLASFIDHCLNLVKV